MNNKNFRTYIELIRKDNEVSISEDLIEKDYMLSLFLSNWAKSETPSLDQLVFKGGTLLTKNYLSYHRISEDLDFVHEDCNIIRELKSKNQQESQIKKLIKKIITEIKLIADLTKLEFEIDRHNSKFIIQRNSRKLYILRLYYKSVVTKKEDFIKIEISFVENLINKPIKKEINNLIDFKTKEVNLIKQLTGFDLKKISLLSYSIDEIILEKIRATITRKQFKPRDVFDLYLINKHLYSINKQNHNKQNNTVSQNKTFLFRKLEASPFQKIKIKENINKFLEEKPTIDLKEIKSLSLIKFDEKELNNFSEELIEYCRNIAKEFLTQ